MPSVQKLHKNYRIDPSQGTHFFQNITSSKVGYITVGSDGGDSFVDWEWMRSQAAAREEKYVRHLHFNEALQVIMDGHRGEAAIVKPGTRTNAQR